MGPCVELMDTHAAAAAGGSAVASVFAWFRDFAWLRRLRSVDAGSAFGGMGGVDDEMAGMGVEAAYGGVGAFVLSVTDGRKRARFSIGSFLSLAQVKETKNGTNGLLVLVERNA